MRNIRATEESPLVQSQKRTLFVFKTGESLGSDFDLDSVQIGVKNMQVLKRANLEHIIS